MPHIVKQLYSAAPNLSDIQSSLWRLRQPPKFKRRAVTHDAEQTMLLL